MNPSLIIAVVASLCVGGASGVCVTRYLVENSVCPAPALSWQQFINVPPLDTIGKTYK